ncbi:MAG: hypothetical protein V4661_15505 [Pseudomonadota bacterium]
MNAHISLVAHRPVVIQRPFERESFALPRWARNLECRLLLSVIAAEKPARNRVLTVDDWNEPSEIGYAGGNASRLRAIAEAAMLDMYAALPQPKRDYPGQPVDTSEFDRRRDEVIAFFRTNGADALIAKVLS